MKKKYCYIAIAVVMLIIVFYCGVHYFSYYNKHIGNTIGNATTLGGRGVELDEGLVLSYNSTIYRISGVEDIEVYDGLSGNYTELFYWKGNIYCKSIEEQNVCCVWKINLDTQKAEQISRIDNLDNICVCNDKIYYTIRTGELHVMNLDGSGKEYVKKCDSLEFVQLFVNGKLNEYKLENWMLYEPAYRSTYQANKDYWYLYEKVEYSNANSYVEGMLGYPRDLYKVSTKEGDRQLISKEVTAYNLSEDELYYVCGNLESEVSYIYRRNLEEGDSTLIAEISISNEELCCGIYVSDKTLVCMVENYAVDDGGAIPYIVDLNTSQVITLSEALQGLGGEENE